MVIAVSLVSPGRRALVPAVSRGKCECVVMAFGLVWFCGPGVLRVVGCYWWCCAHWRAYWLGESQLSALSRLSVLDGDSEAVTDG